MKVIFCIPVHTGAMESECVLSLLTTQAILIKKGIQHEMFLLSGCSDMPVARASLVQMFMDADGTDLFFIDSDIGFDPEAVLKILEREESIVAGAYPLKRDLGDFPVRMKTRDGIPIGQGGLIQAELLPTGFMRIKRKAIEIMYEQYPELKFTKNFIDTGIQEAYDLFGRGTSKDKIWTTEDYAFCTRWTDLGGQLWIYPDIDFSHVGKKSFKGNLHKRLIGLKKQEIELTEV